jgi:hypothetical protein
VIGSRVRVLVTKNKVAPAWQVAELDVTGAQGCPARWRSWLVTNTAVPARAIGPARGVLAETVPEAANA